MRFRIDLKIFLFLILYYFTNQIKIYVFIIMFAIIHELGHLVAGLIMGMKPEKLELTPYGLQISFKYIPKDYNRKILNGNLFEIKKIVVALAGPVTNIIIIFIATNISNNLFSDLMVIYANLLLIIFNLLPIFPLDGGRILKGLICIISGKRKSEKYTNYISFIVLIILTFLSSIAVYYFKNISIFIIILFLWCVFIQEDIVYRKKSKIYDLIEKTIEIE